jgi:hypothetical protein
MTDIIGSLIVIAASVFFFVETLSFPAFDIAGKLGAGFWPRLNLIGMVIIAFIIMMNALFKLKKASFPKEKPQEKTNTMGVLTCGMLLLFFLILIPYLGFLLSAFLGLMGIMYALGERNKRVILFNAFIMVVIVYLSFGKLLFVPMPRGVSIFRELSFYLY